MPPILRICPICALKSSRSKPLPDLTFLASFCASSTSTCRCASSISVSTSPMPRMRDAMRSGWNTSRPLIFSETPTNLIGAPVTLRTDSAAPPRASPSSLVSTMPVSGSAAAKAFAVLTASWPCIASTTNSVSIGLIAACSSRDLAHHRFVDGESSGGIDDDDVAIVLARPVERRFRDRQRLLAGVRRKELGADLARERLQLRDRRRPIDVAAHQQHFLLQVFLEQPRELGRAGRLARALQPGEQDDCRRRDGEVERRCRAAHQRRQLALHDADQRLSRRQRADHLLADGLFAHRGDEILDDRQRDVGLQQRHAHFAQRAVDVGVGEPRFAAQGLDDAAEPLGQIFEHGMSMRERRRRAEKAPARGVHSSRCNESVDDSTLRAGRRGLSRGGLDRMAATRTAGQRVTRHWRCRR